MKKKSSRHPVGLLRDEPADLYDVLDRIVEVARPYPTTIDRLFSSPLLTKPLFDVINEGRALFVSGEGDAELRAALAPIYEADAMRPGGSFPRLDRAVAILKGVHAALPLHEREQKARACGG
jgi:hypothetical protein